MSAVYTCVYLFASACVYVSGGVCVCVSVSLCVCLCVCVSVRVRLFLPVFEQHT